MIREDKFETKTCHVCKRDGWVRKIYFNLCTEEEQLKLFNEIKEVEGAPSSAENCWVSIGASINEAVKEARELALQLNKEIAFCFNEKMVVVNKNSNVAWVINKWYVDVYGKTQKELWKER